MARPRKEKAKQNVARNNETGAKLGFETKLWAAADKLRGNMEPSDYKHVVLGLLSLKYISDTFDARRDELKVELEAHGGQKSGISIFSQESNPTTWRLAHMNLAIRGIEANLGSCSRLTPDSQTLSADAKKSESPRWR